MTTLEKTVEMISRLPSDKLEQVFEYAATLYHDPLDDPKLDAALAEFHGDVDIEAALDEADAEAANGVRMLTHEEVFGAIFERYDVV